MDDSLDQVELPATILAVDEDAGRLEALQTFLADGYSVLLAGRYDMAWDMARAPRAPDLLLLAIPESCGAALALCKQLQQSLSTRSMPIIALVPGTELGRMALEAGAADYLPQPVCPSLLRVRVQTQLALRRAQERLRDRDGAVGREVQRRVIESGATEDVTIFATASLAETRDADTTNHLCRTQRYVRALAWKLSTHPRFVAFLTVEMIALLFRAVPLHDIGKAGIPDRILLKPGKLTAEEFEVMKTHTTLGRDAIARAQHLFGYDARFLQVCKEIALSHQEKWNGTGYPHGLQGDAIPIAARLMAIADVYDALISERVYKAAMPHEEAVQVIAAASGRHFDPDVIEAFLALQDSFRAIAISFADSAEELRDKRKYLELAGTFGEGNAVAP
ncbi:HD-GYP domain-containing protein [Candidatus Symbiobacter mobilis]|uniref:Response regulator-like protein n=1 Tax=Candidatus Symbiobacter mobilis CR TaxID=946483 RepID=U5N8G6_9BURK|nr:HD domain-containing phosphohydrolase [Candidatus Symbiobacter mobilis]AGX87610.1 response regulator-like protein [Candidatus Symbiobacter mobilis CR]